MIYLDHASTTPLDPRVLDAMLPYFRHEFGNPSSVHARGRKVRIAIEDCRERIASLLGAEPSEIVFTSGATESNNTALRGVLSALPAGDRRLVTSRAEHEAILEPAEDLSEAGATVRLLPPDETGRVSPERLTEALSDSGGLVSLMLVNNEVGVVQDIPSLAERAREKGWLFHCDAVQGVGLLDVSVGDLGVDLMSLSAHKVYGPKGVGLLYVRGGTPFRPLIAGGAQERRRRGGTEPVAQIVGFAEALAIAVAERSARRKRLFDLHRRLRRELTSRLAPPYRFNSPDPEIHPQGLSPHILNLSVGAPGGGPLDGEMLLLGLDMEGVCASAGSACTSGAIEPSHVLLAMGRDRDTASATVRLSLGKDTTEDEVDSAADALCRVVERMRRSRG